MKGIILSGGRGSRLDPLTRVTSKQLLPVYDKPMVYYPLCTLMLAGIREVLVISTPDDLNTFRRLLGDGKQWGMSFSFAEQDAPNGIAESFVIGADFVGESSVCLILGDNIFYGATLPERLVNAAKLSEGAVVFAYQVADPSHYAVITFKTKPGEEIGYAVSLTEKPKKPKSSFAVPGLYFYDKDVVGIAKKLKPSSRGELEITDLNRIYMQGKRLKVEILGRGVAWLDAGRPETLLQASTFIQTIQERQGLMVSCPEEIAYRSGFINKAQLTHLIKQMGDNTYKLYLANLLNSINQ